jgi:hypothetical protein
MGTVGITSGAIMSLSDLASLATLASGIAVLASLFYLAQQIRQNTKHSRALIQQGRAARVTETALRLAELRADDEALENCFSGDPDADPKALGRFFSVCRALFVSAEDSFYHHREGLMDEQTFASFEASMQGLMSRTPGVAAGWLLTRDSYEPDFRAYMDRVLGSITPESDAALRTSRWKTALASLSRSALS